MTMMKTTRSTGKADGLKRLCRAMLALVHQCHSKHSDVIISQATLWCVFKTHELQGENEECTNYRTNVCFFLLMRLLTTVLALLLLLRLTDWRNPACLCKSCYMLPINRICDSLWTGRTWTVFPVQTHPALTKWTIGLVTLILFSCSREMLFS